MVLIQHFLDGDFSTVSYRYTIKLCYLTFESVVHLKKIDKLKLVIFLPLCNELNVIWVILRHLEYIEFSRTLRDDVKSVRSITCKSGIKS